MKVICTCSRGRGFSCHPAATNKRTVSRGARGEAEKNTPTYNPRMRKLIVMMFFLLAATASAATFDELFLDRTMRVNYFHTGNHGEELIALDSIVSDAPWPGSRSAL